MGASEDALLLAQRAPGGGHSWVCFLAGGDLRESLTHLSCGHATSHESLPLGGVLGTGSASLLPA